MSERTETFEDLFPGIWRACLQNFPSSESKNDLVSLLEQAQIVRDEQHDRIFGNLALDSVAKNMPCDLGIDSGKDIIKKQDVWRIQSAREMTRALPPERFTPRSPISVCLPCGS